MLHSNKRRQGRSLIFRHSWPKLISTRWFFQLSTHIDCITPFWKIKLATSQKFFILFSTGQLAWSLTNYFQPGACLLPWTLFWKRFSGYHMEIVQPWLVTQILSLHALQKENISALKKYLWHDGTSTQPKKARHGNVGNRDNHHSKGEIKIDDL